MSLTSVARTIWVDFLVFHYLFGLTNWSNNGLLYEGEERTQWLYHLSKGTAPVGLLCSMFLVSLLLLPLALFRTSEAGKHLPAVRETWVWSLGGQDPLEKEMAVHFSILLWIIPWTEEPGGLQSMGSWRVRHDWVTNTNWVTKLSQRFLQVRVQS